MVVNSVNESLKQAYQGSVSAIIQVLNDRLADSGIRTRAIFESGILQVLCEGTKPTQLDQESIVSKVKAILEEISPRNIRRVNINARIIQEHQLLWLEEVKKDPEKHLLWSQEILLARPYLMKHFLEGLKSRVAGGNEIPAYAPSTPGGRKQREKQQFNKGLVGGLIGAGILGLAGFGIYKFMHVGATEIDASLQVSKEQTRKKEPSPTATAITIPKSSDDFSVAVRLAEDAASAAQTAKTKGDWRAIADKWDKAADLMAKVPKGDGDYKTASDRTVRYRNYAQSALKKAQ
jgi:hypothetical protein